MRRWLAVLLLLAALGLGHDALAQAHWRPCHVSTQTTVVCKTGTGIFYGIVVNNANGATIVVYDNTAASGTVLATFTALNTNATFVYNVIVSTGVTVITSVATPDITLLTD